MSNSTELTELCPFCGAEVDYYADDEAVMDIARGEYPHSHFDLPICPDCGNNILPCSCCLPDKMHCSTNCPFENHQRNTDMNQVYDIAVKEIDIHSGNAQMKFSDACPHCGAARRTSDKFCAECGSALAESTWKQDNYTGYLPSIFLHSDLYKEMEEELKASTGLAPSSYSADENAQGFIVVRQYARSCSICVHCGETSHNGKFCTKCGAKININGEISRKLTHEEWREVAINAFYNKHPELRPPLPIKEQEYRVLIAVHRKWIGSADFDDEPLSELEMVTSVDGVEADIATESMLRDFDKDGALYASLKDPLNETIDGIFKKWNKDGWFHKRDTFTILCDIGDEHEFLVVVDITKVN